MSNATTVSKQQPLPEHLAGKFEGTFARKTLAVRVPLILDTVIRQLDAIRTSGTNEASVECGRLAQQIAELRTNLVTVQPLERLTDNGTLSDTDTWNQYLEQQRTLFGAGVAVDWFSVSWLYAECYLYRRLRQVFACSTWWTEYDPFFEVKQKAFYAAVRSASSLAAHLLSVPERLRTGVNTAEELFHFYLMSSLWGNQCDLSLSCGEHSKSSSTTIASQDDHSALTQKILVNDHDQLWQYCRRLSETAKDRQSIQLDVVLDNAGYELFTDLCLVEFLHQSGLMAKDRTRVRLHVKCMPWFVSDAMVKDVRWLLDAVGQDVTGQFGAELKQVCALFQANIDGGVWSVVPNDFWTLPVDFSEMPVYGAELYRQLSEHSQLVLFKGDLNYRKLVGDRSWPLTTSFRESLRCFQPNTAICSLRTIKADVVVGVKDDPETLERIRQLPHNWMETGEFAVYHFLDNHRTVPN